MRPNRQNTNCTPQPWGRNAHAFIPRQEHMTKNTKTCLASLFHQTPYNEISIVCNQVIQVRRKGKNRVLPIFEDCRKRNVYIHACQRSRCVLQDCLQYYDANQNQQFIFTSTQSKSELRDKSNSTCSRTLSQTSIRRLSRPKRESKQKYNFNSNPVSEHCISTNYQQPHRDLMRYQSQRNIDAMFTVDELPGESMQSDVPEAFRAKNGELSHIKSNYKQQLSSHFSKITKHYSQMPFDQLQSFNQHGQISELKLESKNNDIQKSLKKSMDKENMNVQLQDRPPVVKLDCLGSEELIARKSIKEHFKDGQDPKFSFAEVMKKGIIEKKSLAHQWESLRLAGDDQIQNQKRNINNALEIPNQMNQMSELSSIISTNMKEDTRKDIQSQLDSIKIDIESLNNCNKKNVEAVSEIQPLKIEPIKIALKPENDEELFQIFEKTNKENQSQFYVKYNFRILEKKGPRTEVVRISPLRFRKKEEVVDHLMKANIVSKQSDSINIP